MPQKVLRAYIAKLPALLAEKQMRDAAVATFPHLKPAQRRSMMRDWEREIGRSSGGQRQARRLPKEHFAGALAMMGIKVERTERVKVNGESTRPGRAPADSDS